MDVKLLKLIFDYSNNGKLVDRAYLEKFIDIVVQSKDINNYVKHSHFINSGVSDGGYYYNGEKRYNLSTYKPYTKTISVYENAISMLLQEVEQDSNKLSDLEQVFFYNIVISQTILHELEHANQERIKKEEDTLESTILNLSSFTLSKYEMYKYTDYILSIAKMREENYHINYLYAPNERLAEIKSHQEMAEMLGEIIEYVPNLVEYEKYQMEMNMLRGFRQDEFFSPTIYYISNNMKESIGFDWFDFNDKQKSLVKCKTKYELRERLKYGLMIDNNEYNMCKFCIDNNRFN